ncbi:microtubule-associated protein 10 [Notolabrus celidotus]|uniref:microtubule-associated protein 10 n=1 Tax=Notolabrus celidotus TaxID=1203425 RepID=UPI001490864F|nr:microtubule-associated protein 10 [Notolabrus celidotus]
MMPGLQNRDNMETLFSFELLVEHIRLHKPGTVSDQLAVGVRLLDFPTLLIYQPPQSREEDQQEHVFNRGKCCFFNMGLSSLQTLLSSTPLYAMVLDVKEDLPKLVGTSLLSLHKVMKRIRQDVTEHGVSAASSHGERGIISVCSLSGERIGSMSLSYKLQSLGGNVLQDPSGGTVLQDPSGGTVLQDPSGGTVLQDPSGGTVLQRATGGTVLQDPSGGTVLQDPSGGTVLQRATGGTVLQRATGGTVLQDPSGGTVLQDSSGGTVLQDPSGGTESSMQGNIPAGLLPPDCGEAFSSMQEKSDLCRNQTSQEDTMQNEEEQESGVCADMQTEGKRRKQTPEGFKESNYEDTFCPPHLFFCNSAEERSRTERGDHTSPDLNSPFEDSSSEEGDKGEGVTPPPAATAQRGKQDAETRGARGVTPNILGEAVQQLPLLNALLVELSQLNGPSPRQPLSIHPNLSWIYRPASAEPSQNTRRGISPALKPLQSPRNCSTPLRKLAASGGKDRDSTSPRKKLVFGSTKTFNLRMKNISPDRARRRECMELIQNKTQPGVSQGKRRSGKKVSKRKPDLKAAWSLNENIQTAVESMKEDSALRETVTLNQKSHSKQDKRSPGNSEKEPLSLLIHIPTEERDIPPRNKDESEHQSESNQSQSDGDAEDAQSSAGSSSSKSSVSGSAGEGGEEEEDYADDFNSLELSDAYSPDPVSSPESSRAKTPKPPARLPSDSGSEGVRRRAALPVPVRAPSSPPHHALMGTHIIRPRTRASALSFSSSDADRDTSASLQTVLSRKLTRESSGGERSSGTDSLISSQGQRSEGSRGSRAARGVSAESVSSYEPQGEDEDEDQLGSLDFRKEYQHISQLVANKLPGYTM